MDTQQKSAGKAERLLAWIAILYGASILNPWTDVFSQFYVFGAMARLSTNEVLWGGGILMVGAAQWAAWRWHWYPLRLIASFGACLMWMTLAALFVWGGRTGSHPQTLFGALTLPGVMLFSTYGAFQADIFMELLARRR